MCVCAKYNIPWAFVWVRDWPENEFVRQINRKINKIWELLGKRYLSGKAGCERMALRSCPKIDTFKLNFFVCWTSAGIVWHTFCVRFFFCFWGSEKTEFEVSLRHKIKTKVSVVWCAVQCDGKFPAMINHLLRRKKNREWSLKPQQHSATRLALTWEQFYHLNKK